MENIGRAHLDGVNIENHYLTGYTEDEEKLKSLLEDLDSTSGGFVKKNSEKNDKEDGMFYHWIHS